MKRKTVHDVLGWQKNCPRFVSCPVCYGCRAFDSSMISCEKCAENKRNLCDTKKHRSDLLDRMITREAIEVSVEHH